MKSIHLISILLIIAFLSSCGGDSQNNETEISVEKTAASSQLSFYLPYWFDHSGEIKITTATGEIVTSQITSDLNQEVISIPANQLVQIEFIPTTVNITCPMIAGCGNSADYHQDSNDNNVIDQNELFSMNNDFSAKIFLSPGYNQLYFSLLSHIESSQIANSHLKSLSITPNYQQTFVDKAHTQGYEYLANSSYYPLYEALVSTGSIAQLEESLTLFVQDNETSKVSSEYFTNIDKYLSEQQLVINEQSANQYLINEKLKLNRLLSVSQKGLTPSHLEPLNDKILLEQFRDVLAFINIQEQKYNNEISDKISELSLVFTDDAQNTSKIFSEVLSEILNRYSPINDTPAGIYHYQGLDINYTGSPYTWLISGIYNGIGINLELTIPQWRISAARGDFFKATLVGDITSEKTSLTINTDELLLKFDAIEDVFNDEKAKTAIFNLITNISITTEVGEINGRIDLQAARVENESGQLFPILKQLSLSGLLITDKQTTNIAIMAVKHSNSLTQDESDFTYGITLDIPSSGSADLRLSITGQDANIESLDNVNIALKMQGKVLELGLEQTNGRRKILIKGLDGRWLSLKQKNKDYSGKLYFGDSIVGEVITVRSLPGVLFPNGDFHSIF